MLDTRESFKMMYWNWKVAFNASGKLFLQCTTSLIRAEWRSHEVHVAKLLPPVKDAVYDAEDILDEFRWYELKMEVEGNVIQAPSLDFFNSVVEGSFNKVDAIQKRLGNLYNQLHNMGLRQVAQRFDKCIRPITSSFPTEKLIYLVVIKN